jgi:hypothetical protein
MGDVGVCHAFQVRIAPVRKLNDCVIDALTIATTRPSQSSTDAPEALLRNERIHPALQDGRGCPGRARRRSR